MVEKLTFEKVRDLIELELDEFYLEKLREKHGIASDSAVFYMSITRMVRDKKLKRIGRGYYRKIKEVIPVKWWENRDEEPLAGFKFPRSHVDDSTFGIEDLVEVFPGDLILVTGVSNFGKTAIVLNILAENLELFVSSPLLMGSEYTAADGKISPKFKRRLGKMDWVQWLSGNGEPRFTLLPVDTDYEDYIRQDALNAVDWVSLPGEYYLIDRVMKSIKDKVGYGIGALVLQKSRTSEFGEGGERVERYADVHLRIDPFGDESLLTIGKVKAPKSKATGRMWAFKIVDYGANLSNIREVVKCDSCKGFGKNFGKVCSTCSGIGYRDKEDWLHDV